MWVYYADQGQNSVNALSYRKMVMLTPEEKKEQLERYYDSIRRASDHHKEVMKQLNNTEDTKDQ
tara:strand:- start:1081 stop:1272 length:192 start_codon:yes stop_codon:yes gene_type:complete